MNDPIFNVGVNRTFEHNDAAEVVKNATALFISATAVISRIEINGDAGTNVVDEYIEDETNAVGAGAYLLPGFGNVFSAVTLVSGSVTMILRNT